MYQECTCDEGLKPDGVSCRKCKNQSQIGISIFYIKLSFLCVISSTHFVSLNCTYMISQGVLMKLAVREPITAGVAPFVITTDVSALPTTSQWREIQNVPRAVVSMSTGFMITTINVLNSSKTNRHGKTFIIRKPSNIVFSYLNSYRSTPADTAPCVPLSRKLLSKLWACAY